MTFLFLRCELFQQNYQLGCILLKYVLFVMILYETMGISLKETEENCILKAVQKLLVAS